MTWKLRLISAPRGAIANTGTEVLGTFDSPPRVGSRFVFLREPQGVITSPVTYVSPLQTGEGFKFETENSAYLLEPHNG